MSTDDDHELHELVAKTLEANGTLRKLRAQLRASVFLALEEQDAVQNKTPLLNQKLDKFFLTTDGRLMTCLVREFLEFFHLDYTTAVFDPETGLMCNDDQRSREQLAKQLNLSCLPVDGEDLVPLVSELFRCYRQNVSNCVNGSLFGLTSQSADNNCMTEKRTEDVRKKFAEYDTSGNKAIEKGEVKKLFAELFPTFGMNMIDVFVNDQFQMTKNRMSCKDYFVLTPRGVDCDTVLDMHRQLFQQCCSVVGDAVQNSSCSSSHTDLQGADQNASCQSSRDDRQWCARTTSQSLICENGSFSQPATKLAYLTEKLVESKDTGHLDDLVHFSSSETHPPRSVTNNISHNGWEDVSNSMHFGNCSFFDEPVSTNSNSFYRQQNGDAENLSEMNAVISKKTECDSVNQTSGGHSLLGNLPSLPPVPSKQITGANDKQASMTLRSLHNGMTGIGIDLHDDFEYDEDFQSSGHSLSQRSSSNKQTSKDRPENGSITQEIVEEEIDISVDADDPLKSEVSGLNDLTDDCSISQVEGGFDYLEDPQAL